MDPCTLAEFLIRFPEFKQADPAFLQAQLDAAWLEIDPNIWRRKTAVGHGYLTAHNCALSPFGNHARLQSNDGITTYFGHYQRIMFQVACGYAVL